MDIPKWYAIALGSLILLYVVACLFFAIASLIQAYGKLYFLKYLFYPQIPRYLRRSRKTTRFDVLILLAFLIANTLALTIDIKKDTDRFIKRSGLISVINLMPLFIGGQMNIVASRCGVGLRAYTRIHRLLGRIAVLEGFIHVVASFSSNKFNFRTQTSIAGLIVST